MVCERVEDAAISEMNEVKSDSRIVATSRNGSRESSRLAKWGRR
jgi:hypothetical protein